LWTRRLLGFTPLPSPPHVFAIDDARLRYAALHLDRHGIRLRDSRQLRLAPETFMNGLLGGPLRDPGAFREVVGALVKDIPGGVREASLVVPDAWLRVTYAECGDLPRGGAALDEVLRWKLRRLVPFRVDELRIGAAFVSALPGQEEPRRLLMGFAIEQLLAQLEDAFLAHGVRLGQISNASLSVLDALALRDERSFTALMVVEEDGYTLILARRGEPVLHRYKAASGVAADTGPGGSAVRDLRLTRNFLDENFAGSALESVLLLAPPAVEPIWLERLEQGLGRRAAPVDDRRLPALRSDGAALPPWRELAPMVGAARRMVA
jgi:hypothetical protein